MHATNCHGKMLPAIRFVSLRFAFAWDVLRIAKRAAAVCYKQREHTYPCLTALPPLVLLLLLPCRHTAAPCEASVGHHTTGTCTPMQQ
jgi:hypothetical protein